MSEWRSRLTRLEARQCRQHPPERAYFTSIVRVPAGILWEDRGAWLAEQACVCGVIGCNERTIHIVLPKKAASVEEWTQRYGDHR